MKMLVTAALAVVLSSGLAAADCAPGSFVVEQFSPTVYDDCRGSPCPALKLIGVLANNCEQPAGAKVQITAMDALGNVIDVIEGWPASTRNIHPGATYPFDLGPLMTYRPNMRTFSVEVIDVQTWR